MQIITPKDIKDSSWMQIHIFGKNENIEKFKSLKSNIKWTALSIKIRKKHQRIKFSSIEEIIWKFKNSKKSEKGKNWKIIEANS